jgi:hypothetical protein
MENKKHIDPPRYPTTINPIEQNMKRMFNVTIEKLVIDVTKQLTKEVKKK